MLLFHGQGEGEGEDAPVLSHRRSMEVQVTANGRRLAVTAHVENNSILPPPPLALVGRMAGSSALGLCTLAQEGHYDVSLPGFDPYGEGIKGVVGRFKAPSMVGCDALDSFGFTVDFGVVWSSGSAETYWHMDCLPPVTAISTCTVHRVYLVPHMPDMNAILNPVFETDGNATFWNASVIDEQSVGARRLGPGAWPPPAIRYTSSRAACPSLELKNIPTSNGFSLSDSAPWRKALLDGLNVDPSATPAEQAALLCQTSVLCMIGWAVGSGSVFQKS